MSTIVRDEIDMAREADLKRTFADIRDEAARARSRQELTGLYRDAEALIALTYAPSWQQSIGNQAGELRRVAASEFATMARAINRQAGSIGTKADYDETWGGMRRVYGSVNSEGDLRQIFADIRGEVAATRTREDLTHLYRRAEYLITLTYAPAWQKKFGAGVESLRRIAAAEFATTARAINQRAATVGASADYDETWGGDGL